MSGTGGGGTGGESAGAGGSGVAGSDMHDADATGMGGTSDAGSSAADGGAVASSGCGKPRTLKDGHLTIQTGNAMRTYYLRVPSNYDNKSPID